MQTLHFAVTSAMWFLCLLQGSMVASSSSSLSSERAYKKMSSRRDPKQGRSHENEVLKTLKRKNEPFKLPIVVNSASSEIYSQMKNGFHVPGTSSRRNPTLGTKLKAFLSADRNGDGFVSGREYAKVYTTSRREAKIVFRSFDADHDGMVSKAEYIKASENGLGDKPSKRKYNGASNCDVESINACAITPMKLYLKGKLECAKIRAFSKCVTKRSRKCNQETRNNLKSIILGMSTDLSSSTSCEHIPRHHHKRKHERQVNSNDAHEKNTCNPAKLMECSRDLFVDLLANTNSCEPTRKYKVCMRKSYSPCQRQTRKRLRHSIRTVRKLCWRLRDFTR